MVTVQEQRTWFLPFMFVLALKAGSDGTQLQFDAVSVTTTALNYSLRYNSSKRRAKSAEPIDEIYPSPPCLQ